jgi:thioredoxin-related protein
MLPGECRPNTGQPCSDHTKTGKPDAEPYRAGTPPTRCVQPNRLSNAGFELVTKNMNPVQEEVSMKQVPATRSTSKSFWPRAALGLGLIAALLTAPLAQAAPSSNTAHDPMGPNAAVSFVDHLTDLPTDLAYMQAHKIPMMIFFHASYCGYCVAVDNEFIIPMRLDPKYKNRLLIRRVQVDDNAQYIGIDGQKHGYPYLANKLHVRGVPYILFLAPDGSRITSIQGTAMDYYGYYLNQDINLATDCAKDPKQKICDGSADGPGL